MRLNNEYQALISKINVKKSNYSEKEMVISNELEHDILETYEKSKKYTIWLVVASAVMVVMAGLIYDFLETINTKWIMWVIIGICLAVFLTLLGIEIFYKAKLKKLNNKKLKEDASKDDVKKDIISLNDQISILCVSVIVMNEHFYELESIKDEEQRRERWNKYIKETVGAINRKYDYHPTYSEYEEYYRNYEYFMKEKESLE